MTKYPNGQTNSGGEFEEFDQPGLDGSTSESAVVSETVKPLSQLFFSLLEVSKIFGKSGRTIRWWADTGRLKTVKIGRARHVTDAEIARLANSGEG
jgi:hypothetical protein